MGCCWVSWAWAGTQSIRVRLERDPNLVNLFFVTLQSRIFSVARSLSYTLSSPTSEWDESLLPLPFKITAERLERSRKERQTISKPGVHNLEEASEGGMLEPVVEREEEDLERRAVDRLGEKMGGLGLSEKGEMKEPSVNKKSGFSCLIM